MFAIITISYELFLKLFYKWRTLWHRPCPQFSCQETDFFKHFNKIIPDEIPNELKYNPNHFTRNRDLPLNKLIALTLSMTANGATQGAGIKAGLFFQNARRSGLWPNAKTVHRSSITKARAKLKWQVFQTILDDSVSLAYRLWPTDDSRYLWNGMSVYAIDGSGYNLPATDEIREYFDPKSGLQYPGKGYYPQCLVSTVYDVFRRLPVARTVVECNGCERTEMKNLLPSVPSKSVWLFDRGYPGYDTINHLLCNYDGYFVFRSPGKSTFPAVEKFVKSGRNEGILWILPSHEFRRKVSPEKRKDLKAIRLRVIRLESPDGTVSVLLTNLFEKQKYSYAQIIELYFRRWEVENYYRDEKITMRIEKFHSTKPNGILQELYASTIMSIICRTLMMLSSHHFHVGHREPQFKNAMAALATDAAFLAAYEPESVLMVFKELLSQIAIVRYYRPKNPRKSQPRVNKGPINKWNRSKIKKMAVTA